MIIQMYYKLIYDRVIHIYYKLIYDMFIKMHYKLIYVRIIKIYYELSYDVNEAVKQTMTFVEKHVYSVYST